MPVGSEAFGKVVAVESFSEADRAFCVREFSKNNDRRMKVQ